MNLLWYLPFFLLVFVRLSAFFITAPLWMDRQIPGQLKWGFAFFTSILVVGVMPPDRILEMDGIYILLLLKEVLVGVCLGFFTSLLLYSVQLAGSFVDLQSGFAMASMFNPQTGMQEAMTGRLYYIIAISFFLAIDGHHLLLRGVLASYQWIPVMDLLPASASNDMALLSLDLMKNMFWIAILIAVPLVGTLFLVDIALGILSKTVPQMNLFVVGIPIKMVVHFIILYLSMPSFFYMLGKLVSTMVHSMEQVFKILGS